MCRHTRLSANDLCRRAVIQSGSQTVGDIESTFIVVGHSRRMINRLNLGAAVASCVLTAAAPASAAERPLTFNRDVAPIIFQNCTPCHRPGESAPFTLLNYDDVKQRARQIVTTTEHRFMPPWKPDPEFRHFEGERWLDDDEIDRLRDWVEGGAVEGDPRDRPTPPRFPE